MATFNFASSTSATVTLLSEKPLAERSVFHASLALANEARVPYSGVLCGRSTWQAGLAAYVAGGKEALRRWLETQGIKNIQALNEILQQGAQPWWNIYGGRDQITIVEQLALPSSAHRPDYH